MFPAGNPVSHVIPNWMRHSGLEYSSPLLLFVSTRNRVSELAIQPVARSSFDDSAHRSRHASVGEFGRAVSSPAAHGAWSINFPHSPEDAIWNRSGFHLYVSSLHGRRLRFPDRRVLTRILQSGIAQVHLCAILGTFPRDSLLFRPIPPSFRNPPLLYSFHRLKSIFRSYCSLPVLQALTHG